MGRRVLGLEVSEKSIRLALVRNGARPQIMDCRIFAGAEPSDAAGDAMAATAAAIKSELAKNPRLSRGTDTLSLCISNSQTVARPVTLPAVKNDELSAALEFELSKSFPGIAKTHAISFKEYSRTKKEIKGIVSFSPVKALDPYRQILSELDFKNFCIDVAANCDAKAAAYFMPPQDPDEIRLICNIGASSTQMTVIRKSMVLHSRQIPEGDGALRDMICTRLGVAQDEYEKMLEAGIEKTQLLRQDIASLRSSAFGDILEQMSQTVEFFNNGKSGDDHRATVSSLILTGRGSMFPGLSEEASNLCGLPARVAASSQIDQSVFLRAFSAIGAAVREG